MLPRRLAEIKRRPAKKSLALDSCRYDDGCMFSVFCKGHRARVILGNRSITRLDNTDHGIELHWHCPCGTDGMELYGVTSRIR